jgi:hypothetical protein
MADPTTTPTTDLAPRTVDKIPVAIGDDPISLDEQIRYAKWIAESSLVPKEFRGKPADILVAIGLGKAIGMYPAVALQSMAVINGRPGLHGDGLLAVVVASAAYVSHTEYFEVVDREGTAELRRRVEGLTAEDLKRETTRAVCTFRRKGQTDPVTRTFSIAQAKRANLIGKSGPWTEYPDRMLQMRARGFAARDAFPDVLKGLRTVEELADIPVEDDPPAPVVRRRSETPAE